MQHCEREWIAVQCRGQCCLVQMYRKSNLKSMQLLIFCWPDANFYMTPWGFNLMISVIITWWMILIKHSDIGMCTCSSFTRCGSIYINKSEEKSEKEKKERCIRRENVRRETNERCFISICESIIIIGSTKSLQIHNNLFGSMLR